MPRVPKLSKSPAANAVSIATRLKRFGLSATNIKTTDDLTVPANQTVVLDAADHKFSKQLTRLTPENIGDLKNWIGVPDEAFAHPATPSMRPMTVIPVHDVYTPAQTTDLYGVARDYLLGNSGAVSPQQVPALNAWLKTVAVSIPIITFQDITVEAGATLVVNPSIAILFARYITILRNGVIRVMCTHGGINCAGIRGGELLAPQQTVTSVTNLKRKG